LRCLFSQKGLRYLCRTLRTLTYRYDLVVRCAKLCSQFLLQIWTLFESPKFCEIVIRHLSIFFSFSEGRYRIPLNFSSQSPTTNRDSPPISYHLTSSFTFTSTLEAEVTFPLQIFPLFPSLGPASRRFATSNMSRLPFKK
jgi:hypothetical protein